MKKLRIVVDVDGVLADFIGPYEAKFGKWVDNTVKGSPAIKDFWDNPPYEFWANLPVLVDSDIFNAAVEGHEVIFLTNTASPKGRREWLLKNNFLNEHVFMNTPRYGDRLEKLVKERLLICNAPGTSKKATLAVLKPDLFIDDYGKNINDATALGIPTFKLNGKKDCRDRWGQLYKIIYQLATKDEE